MNRYGIGGGEQTLKQIGAVLGISKDASARSGGAHAKLRGVALLEGLTPSDL